MPVQNRIVKVQKRNRALVKFDSDRIGKAILRAAESIGGFHRDFLPGMNDKDFQRAGFGRKHRGVSGGRGHCLPQFRPASPDFEFSADD